MVKTGADSEAREGDDMTVKEYLQQIYRCDCEIKRIKDQINRIHDEMYSLSSPSAQTDIRIQTSTSGDSMLRLIAKADEITRDLHEREERLCTLRAQICRQIEELEDERYRHLLYMRYSAMCTWEEIAVDMHMVVRHIYRLHGDALQAFGKIHRIP